MRKYSLLAVGLALAGSLLAEVKTGPRDTPKMKSDMVVSTKFVAENANKIVVLHVGRDRAIYDAGHIPGARFLALSDITTGSVGVDNELPPASQLAAKFGELGIGDKTRVVLYGDHAGLFAARAYFTLDYLGAGNRAALMDGGLEKWKSEGRPLSKESGAAVMPAQFTAKPNAKVLADFAEVRELSKALGRPAFAEAKLVDARPEADFANGNIPGAVNMFWQRNLESEQDPSLRPPYELRKMYEGLGVTRDKPVITYCRTGVQASYSYFILKWLGYDVAMYDGSYQEWSKKQ